MTFVKNPSPCPIPRMNTERKPSATEACHATDGSQLKSVKSESPKWEPLRKFAPMASKTSAESSPRQGNQYKYDSYKRNFRIKLFWIKCSLNWIRPQEEIQSLIYLTCKRRQALVIIE